MRIEVKVPAIGESINEATVGRWLKEDGSFVEVDDVLCEVESEKATVEVVAEDEGILIIVVAEGETVEIGAVIAEINKDSKAATKKEPAEEKEEAASMLANDETVEKSKISPLAVNILKEAGITTESVSGSGAGGRITKSDALKAVESAKKDDTAAEKKAPTTQKTGKPDVAAPVAQPAGSRTIRRERMTTLRKTIARRMLEARQGTAMLTTINEIDMSAIMAARAKYKEKFKEKYDVNLGFMSFFVKAVSIALQEFPVVNAMIDGDDIVYHDFCDIAIAVSTPKGLVVPVIRNAETLSMAEIEKTVADLAIKARDSKLTIEEMTGGTFSITNGGVFGSLISTPLINTPQSAILGMHTIQERPMAIQGEVRIRPMMYISLSYDHRIIDGRESVSFVVRVKEILDDPLRLLLHI